MSIDETLTDEDIATLRRCRQIAFWRGSVPFTIGSVLMVGVAQRMGFFIKRSRLAIPSYILATMFGYLGGKLAYTGECKRMFLGLKNSRIKDQLLSYSPKVGGYIGDEDPSSSPMIVNTPTRPTSPQVQQSADSDRPLSTYAERRDFYRGQSPNQAFSFPEKQSSVDSTKEDDQSSESQRDSYFDQNRPFSSYQFDDNYRSRDD